MISRNAIYCKTDKGVEAIAARKYGLSPKLRSVLILVDGKRGFDELVGLSAAFGDTMELLGSLHADGFIEARASLAPDSLPLQAAAMQSAAKLPSARPAISLRDAQRFVVRRLTDLLGPNGEPLCLKLESSRNADQFNDAVERAIGVVREFRGTGAAAQFTTDVEPYRHPV